MDYSLLGQEGFRKRLDQVVLKNQLDPEEVEIQFGENRRASAVWLEIRYLARTSFFLPLTREVVIRKEMPLRPIE